MPSAKNIVSRIESQKDRCHALLEREGTLEKKLRPLRGKLAELRTSLSACQMHVHALRDAGEASSKIERARDRCAAILAKMEKLERKSAPLEEKISSVKSKYAEEHSKLRTMRG